ncbi:apolipoprotein N-acyltransferase [Helicobacter zhangjianzhongii]|uniref:Apolipoprotein N-acyltransferase n=1 Tax=Helicobacter zhangjianzhongii TaxID=2974574 RepID=A0ACC6FQR6_9HELI|nr:MULTISPECIES: apolipoprotein N-acyltransferase [unclassified Helicobacter]MDL0079548.1 apolipoprotein N-acyltransferase [Helicobacter sp. CPD2-1]MDL0081551.1 apolipoprotein N-acyltransferase [Helicobacter sp. XJK30-2]
MKKASAQGLLDKGLLESTFDRTQKVDSKTNAQNVETPPNEKTESVFDSEQQAAGFVMRKQGVAAVSLVNRGFQGGGKGIYLAESQAPAAGSTTYRAKPTPKTQFFSRLLLGLLYALGFCAWLYVFALIALMQDSTLEASFSAHIASALLLSILVLASFSIWLYVPRAIGGYFGFFVGVLLFYWIGLSFRFSIAPFLLGFVCVGVGLAYAALLYLGLYFTSKIYRIFSLFALGIFAPFSFDWFVPQSWLAYSVFGVGDLAFIGILCALALGLYRGKARVVRMLVSAVLLLACVDWAMVDSSAHRQALAHITPLADEIVIVQSAIPQDLKWEQSTIDSVLEGIMSDIDSAIMDSKQMIIFPETILPFVLNHQQGFPKRVLEAFLAKSAKITIVLGAFSEEGSQVHNSTYVFKDMGVEILHKVILAPFGEKIPLPDFLAKPLYKLFFGIDDGLQAAKDPQDFSALGRLWRNAICYEGTSKEIYTNAPKYLVMISNNAWFYPSIEPFLQRVLLKYYARKFGTILVHSANYSRSMIITPLIDDTRATRILSHKE